MKSYIKKVLLLLICLSIALSAIGCNQGGDEDNGENHQNKFNHYIESPNVEIAETGLTWPEGQVLPSTTSISKQIDRVVPTGFSREDMTTLVALQGLVNREKPRILIEQHDNLKKWQVGESDFEYTDFRGRDKSWEIFVKYKDYYKGFVVYETTKFTFNGEKYDNGTVNLATTVAGLKDLLPVNEKTMNKLKDLGIDLPIVEDFRGKFNNNVEVYNYLYDNYWKDCSKRLLVSAHPGEHKWEIRDIGVAAKTAVIWLDPRIVEEAEVVNKFLKDLTPGKSVITGWWPDEGAGIKIGTDSGIATIPGDYYKNYTLHAAMDRNINPPAIPDKPKLENKIYIALTLSDGDNLQYNQGHMKTVWDNKRRGEIPISWTFCPALVDAGPDVMNYYYETATENDCFVSGPSGNGYASMENMPKEHIEAYAKWTEQYLAKSNMNVVTIWSNMDDIEGGYDIYTKNIRSLYGLTIQKWDGESQYKHFNNVPVVAQFPNYAKEVNPMVTTILSRVQMDGFDGTKPLFYAEQAESWRLGVSDLITVANRLKKELGEDKVEFVRLDHLFMLINEYENLPYNLSLSQDTKVTSSDDSQNAKLAADGTYNTMWESSKEGDKWLSFDLGDVYNISRYVMENAGMDLMDKSLNTKDYEVLVSENGEDWTQVDKVVGNTDNARDIDLEEPVRARYVKFVITNPGEDGVARVADIEIYGTKA